jgi:universal stress protein E
MTQPILLVAAGPKQHTPALQRAFDLARRAEVPVHVALYAHDALIERSSALVHPDVRRRAQKEFLDEHDAWVAGLVASWRKDGLRATGEVVWAPSVHEAILDTARALGPSLIVKDVGQEKLLRRITYTALDWRLLRAAPAPLMLVQGVSARMPRRILAAVDTMPGTPDPGPLNERVLREALKLADWADADVQVGHVFPYVPVYPAAYRALEGVYLETRSANREAFEAFCASHQVPAAARHWLEGNPAQRLVDLAREQAIDLLVLGSSHHGALDRLLLGSTAETLLFQAPCDVLLVKPDAFAAALAAA